MERKQAHVGDCVIYTDPQGEDRNALVTAVWSEAYLNVVFLSKNPDATDNFGRQIEERESSLEHVSLSDVHGKYWRWPGEEKRPYQPPLET